MSKKKPSRNARHAEPAKRPDQAGPYRVSGLRIVLTTALALAAGAVFFVQLANPGSMFGAMRRVEVARLLAADGVGAMSTWQGESWQRLTERRDSALRQHPDQEAHFAVGRLLRMLTEVERGQRSPQEVATTARQLAALDSENLISRLAMGVASDYPDIEPDPRTPRERFEAVRRAVEGDRKHTRTTLYNAEFMRAWLDTLRPYFARPDVAVALAATTPHYAIHDHFAALPLIQRRLASLEARLRANGEEDAADACRRWVVELALGLIDADPEAATRLLCADLLAGAFPEPGDPVGDAARCLRPDFHRAADAAPADLTDQGSTLRPAIDPPAYRSALRRLVAAGGFTLIALGGMAAFIAVGVAALVAAATGRSGVAVDRRCPLHVGPTLAFVPALTPIVLVTASLATFDVFSEMWSYATGVALLSGGGMLATAIAGILTTRDGPTSGLRTTAAVGLAVVALLLPAVPPPTVAAWCRGLELRGLLWPALLIGPSLLVAVGCAVTPARLRTIAVAAALVWCVNSLAGLGVYQLHRLADHRYQDHVVAGRMDELAARLGPDWADRYLQPAEAWLTAAPPTTSAPVPPAANRDG